MTNDQWLITRRPTTTGVGNSVSFRVGRHWQRATPSYNSLAGEWVGARSQLKGSGDTNLVLLRGLGIWQRQVNFS